MGKHDVRDIAASEYYRNRIESLQKALGNAQSKVELQEAYITNLEKQNHRLSKYVQYLKDELEKAILREVADV